MIFLLWRDDIEGNLHIVFAVAGRDFKIFAIGIVADSLRPSKFPPLADDFVWIEILVVVALRPG